MILVAMRREERKEKKKGGGDGEDTQISTGWLAGREGRQDKGPWQERTDGSPPW